MNLYTVLSVAQFTGLLLFTPYAVDALSHSLPSSFPRCRKAELDTDRCKNVIFEKSLHLLGKGIPELGLPSINPLEVAELIIGESGGPVSLSVRFRNAVVTGLTDATFYGGKFDFKDKNNMSIIFTSAVETVNFDADYEMSGRMLLIPLSGKGRCKFTYYNLNSTLGPTGKMITIKGKEYFNVTDFYILLHKIENVNFQFDNLFNGDKNVGSPILKLINDNWQKLWGEMFPVFLEVFKNLYITLAKRVFDRVPFDDIFLD
ncbi:hypothetical protein R5R35_003268 [Gryllus longicercus]|uniref:Protein takeout n=1 Tax=Gryllus longicercus TaxID=2509291 RepID=A0AAN9Z903_9ORTH